VVYSLGITNNGPSDAAAVNLSDPLPAHMTFVSLSQASGPVFVCTTPAVGAAGTVTCTIASLANGASASFTLTSRLTEFAVGGVTLTNTATATTTSTDAVPANNTASATVLSLFLPLVQPAQNFVGSGVLGPVLAAAERVNRASQAAAVPTPAPAPVAAAPARAITPPSTGDAGLVPPNDNSLSVGSILLDVAGVLAVPALLLALVRPRQRRRLAGSARGEH